jgi:hypothetical protein
MVFGGPVQVLFANGLKAVCFGLRDGLVGHSADRLIG